MLYGLLMLDVRLRQDHPDIPWIDDEAEVLTHDIQLFVIHSVIAMTLM